MKLVFFSTNSSSVEGEIQNLSEKPLSSFSWEKFSKEYSELDIVFVVQLPARFILDKGKKSLSNIKTVILGENTTAYEIAEKIREEFTDSNHQKTEGIAIPVTYWAPPYDWLSLKDSLIASILQESGILCAAHSKKASLISFDKKNTHDFLVENRFNYAKSVFIQHEMFRTEVNHREMVQNVYKEFILSEVEKLSLPLVIKSTSGLSSWGMDVVKTHKEAFHILNSKRNNGDRLVEEFLEGYSFGIEIYGNNKKYTFSPLLINSVNQFGLTSPRQNVKLGPVEGEKWRLSDLYRDLDRLSNLLNLNGIAQVDLVFHDDKWYIIEVNARISGMTETAAISMGLSLQELIVYASFLGKKDFEENETFKKIQNKRRKNTVLNMKLPLITDEKMEELLKIDGVEKVNTIENLEAKQLREKGYSEIIFTMENFTKLEEKLEFLKDNYKDSMEKVFYDKAKELFRVI